MVFIKQLPELTKVVDKIGGLSLLRNGATGLYDFDKYVDAVKGLNKETALLALSTTNLTKEETANILAKAGIVSQTEAETIANSTLIASNLKLGTSFKLLGKAALASIKAMLTNPLTWILIGVPAAIKLLDWLIVTQKELAESVDSLMEEYNNALSKANSYRDTIEELIPVYEKLSDGVNGLGKNVSLTEEEFNEYNKTVNKIAEMFPDMVKGWTDEGNAIIDLKGNVELLRDAYREAQQEAYNLLISTGKDANGNDIIKNFNNLDKTGILDLGKPTAGKSISKTDAYKALMEFASYGTVDELNKSKSLGLGTLARVFVNNQTGFIGTDLSNEDLHNAQKSARALAATYKAEIDSSLHNVRSLADAYLHVDLEYKNFSSEIQSALSRVINSIDVDQALNFKSKEDVSKYVQGIIFGLKDNPDVQTALLQLFSVDTSEMALQDANEFINALIEQIATVIGENPIELRTKLGFDSTSELLGNLNSVNRNAAEKYGDYYINSSMHDTSWYDNFAKENSINTQAEIAFWNQCIDESKTKEDAAKKYLHESNEYLSTVGFTGFTEEQSKQIDDFQSKIGSLGSTLQSIRNGEEINMTDLIQEFPELAGQTEDLDNAITKLINDSLTQLIDKLDGILPPEVIENLKNYTNQMTGLYPKLTDAYSGMHNIYDVMQQVKEEFDETTGIDKFTDSTLQSIAGINEHMNSMVAAWHANGVSSRELFDELQKEYQRDLENYGQALVKKYEVSEEFYNSVGMTDAELVKQFGKDYEVDIENCKTYNNAKLSIYNQTIGQLTENLKKFYNAESDGVSAELKRLEAVAANMDERTRYRFLQSNGYYEFMASYQKYTNAVEGLNKNVYKGIDATFSSVSKGLKDNADAASKAASEYNELFDFFERRVEIINQALERLDGNLENVNGSLAKNMLVSGKIKIVSEEIKDYTSAMSMYQQKANEELSKLNSDLQDKIKNGAVNITQLIGESGEEVNNILTSYQNWANKVNDCNQKLIELKETLRDLELDKFNNIVQEYTDRFDIFEAGKSLIEKQISFLEESGENIASAFYSSQVLMTKKQLEMLEKEKAALAKQLSESISSGNIQNGTDEWLEMCNAVNELDEKILDCRISVEQLNKSIRELHELTFEKVQAEFKNIGEEIQNIIGLMDDMEVSSEEGVWTNSGLTRLGSYAQMYELAENNIRKYADEIEHLNDEYVKGTYSTNEYLERLTELSESQWEEVNASVSAKKAIMDLNKTRVEAIKTGIEKKIKAYQELINKQKEALDNEKDIRDYEKTIAEKTSDIKKFQNQIAALAGDSSAAANAKRIKLQDELNKAMDDLNETQYNHSIEEQKKALDVQLEDFEDARQKEIDELEAYLKDEIRVYTDSLNIVKDNTQLIYGEILKITEDYGIQISSTISDAWRSGENAIAEYGANTTSGFVSQLDIIENRILQLQNTANVTAASLLGMLQVKSDVFKDHVITVIDRLNELQIASDITYDELVEMLSIDSGIATDEIKRIVNALMGIQDESEFTYDALIRVMDAKSDGFKEHTVTIIDALHEVELASDMTYDAIIKMISQRTGIVEEEVQNIINALLGIQDESQYTYEALVNVLNANADGFKDSVKSVISALYEIRIDANTTYDELVRMLSAKSGVAASEITTIINGLLGIKDKADYSSAALIDMLNTNSEDKMLLRGIDVASTYLTALQDEAGYTGEELENMLSAKADNLIGEFDVAMTYENNLITATNILNDSLIKTLEGSYNISGIVSQLAILQEEARKTTEEFNKIPAGAGYTPPTTTSTTPSTTPSSPSTGDNSGNYHNLPQESQYSQGAAQELAKRKAEKQAELNAANTELSNAQKRLNELTSFAYSSYYNTSTGRYTQEYEKLARDAQYSQGAAQKKNQIDSAINTYNANKGQIPSAQAAVNTANAKIAEINDRYYRLYGFAHGVHKLGRDMDAWTQEYGDEIIMSPTRNAILTPLKKGDTVLTKEQTDNIFKLSKISPDEIFGRFKMASIGKSMQPVLSIGNVVTVNGNIDDTNIQKMQTVATNAIDKAFKKFSDEILKR